MFSSLCETMQWPLNNCLIAYKNFPQFPQDSPIFVDKGRQNAAAACMCWPLHKISLSCLCNKSSILTRMYWWASIGIVVHNTYTTGTCVLPDIHTCPRATGPRAHVYICIRQSTQACGISIA